MDKMEIMAPAGSYEALQAAINAGANSVYFGIEQLNMRARAANNFTIEDLKKIVEICQNKNVKTYLTLNTIMYDHDINLMKKICDTAKEVGLTAVICSDVAAMSYAHSINLEVHISTQANVSNIETVKFYSQFADVVVLARELTLQQIKRITEQVKEQNIKGPKGELVEIEIFVHGALCVAISGKCYMSLATYNSSANRGACLQNCRRSYKLVDEETGDELVVDNKYIMSPKDLCTIGFIDKILETGVKVLKIEGRGRSPEYVHTVVTVYREAVDSFLNGSYDKDKIAHWITELEKVFNRGFWHGGYYLGKQLGEWSGVYGSKATKEKIYLGRAKNYFTQPKIGEFHLETGEINEGDEIIITGPTTGVIQTTVGSIFVNEKKTDSAVKGQEVTIPIENKIRANDKLFKVIDVA
ncbi:MAG TPA: U32 family peptidase [Dehalococcoidia bacterium]|jgi:putative protease|nr:U32 family peptidase [Dehalococcoidia bacterium]|tara:strand:- start:853 stop:2091 length:1239 start_codon:yes stop_codon:yes gene_type:complete